MTLTDEPISPTQYITVAFAVSLLVHILLALFLFRTYSPHQAPEIFLEATIEMAPPRQTTNTPPPIKHQIVTQPDRTLTTPPLDSSFVSERDSSTVKEQIKRGEDPQAALVRGDNHPPAPKSAVQPAQPPKPSQSNEHATTKPETKPPAQLVAKNLRLDTDTLLEKYGSKAAQQANQPAMTATRTIDLNSYKAFSHPAGSGASVFGTQGSNDYLPTLPDGDITLLNAKAERFAVFVRRVALQVFSRLRQSGWEHLSLADIRSSDGYTTVRAILSPEGRLLKVILEAPSGSTRFDTVLQAAVQQGARDSNPPPAARTADGSIQFIFKARSWAETSIGHRGGFPEEQRWLMLATGLE